MNTLKHHLLLIATLAVAACASPQDPDAAASDAPDVATSVDVPNTDRPNPTDRPTAVDRVDPTDRVEPVDQMEPNDAPDPVDSGPNCAMSEVSCGMGPAARCANLQTDTANCGACDTQCGMGQSCAAGVCTCPLNTTTCGMGAMATCVNTQTDTNNCGACNNVCPMGNTCVAGACVAPCAAPRMMCGMSCTDTQTDRNNCGACNNVCPMAQSCVAGVCACPMGQSACGMGAALSCVNQQTDRTNCGGCGVTCGMAQSCNAGSCACPMATPNACGAGAAATCTSFQTDPANCGRCGNACAAGQLCMAGACVLNCPAPNLICGMAPMQSCVAAQTDVNNCGACGNSCAPNAGCSAGVCTARNGSPATAIAITLPATVGQRVTVTGTNVGGATAAAGQCDQRAVYYSVTIAAQSVLYLDTFGSMYDTRVGVRPAGAMSTMACIDDSCAVQQSQTALVVPAGTHLIEVSGYNGATGVFTLNVAAIPAAVGGRNQPVVPDANRQFVRGNTAAAGTMAIEVPALGSKKADLYYYLTCPSQPAGLHVDTCSSDFDTMLSVLHGGIAAPSTNTDDNGGNASCLLGRNGSNFSGTQFPAGAGIHGIYVTGFGAAEGLYTLHYSAACADNQVQVGTVCRSVQALLTVATDCGAPGRACAAGESCSAGVCVAAGGNTNPPPLTYAVGDGSGTAQPIVGGPGGPDAFRNACAQGHVLIGVNTSEAGPFGGAFGTTRTVGHVAAICAALSTSGTSGLGGINAQRIAFTRVMPNLASHGAALVDQQNPRDMLCPPGHVVTGFRAATNGNIVDSLALQCAPLTISGNGPFTVNRGQVVLVGAVGGEGNTFTQTTVGCPLGTVANGILGRAGSGLDAFSVLCNTPKVFQIVLDPAVTTDGPALGGGGGDPYRIDCPAGQVLAGANLGAVDYVGAPALTQMRAVCRPITGLIGAGLWRFVLGATSNVGNFQGQIASATVDTVCASNQVPVALSGAIATYPSQLLFHCASPTIEVNRSLLLPAGADSPTIGMGGGALSRRDCPASSFASGLVGGAGDIVDRIALRCTPFAIR